MGTVVRWAAIVFVFLFAVVWLVLSWQVLTFDQVTQKPPLAVGSQLVVVAGFLATTVGTATAGWLGIEIQKPTVNGSSVAEGGVPWAGRLKEIFANFSVVTVSCWTYLAIALIVLLLTIFKSDVAPQVYQAFMLSGLGWLAGAFAAVKPPA